MDGALPHESNLVDELLAASFLDKVGRAVHWSQLFVGNSNSVRAGSERMSEFMARRPRRRSTRAVHKQFARLRGRSILQQLGGDGMCYTCRQRSTYAVSPDYSRHQSATTER